MDVVLPSLVAGSAENVVQEALEFLNKTTEPKQGETWNTWKKKTITLPSDHCYCGPMNQITEKTGKSSSKDEKKNERQ